MNEILHMISKNCQGHARRLGISGGGYIFEGICLSLGKGDLPPSQTILN